MSDKTETKAQNGSSNNGASDRASASFAPNPFQKLADAQIAQMTAMWGEIEKLQNAGLEHTKTALDETARLSKETLGYWASLGAESRRMTQEAVQRSMDLFSSVAR